MYAEKCEYLDDCWSKTQNLKDKIKDLTNKHENLLMDYEYPENKCRKLING